MSSIEEGRLNTINSVATNQTTDVFSKLYLHVIIHLLNE